MAKVSAASKSSSSSSSSSSKSSGSSSSKSSGAAMDAKVKAASAETKKTASQTNKNTNTQNSTATKSGTAGQTTASQLGSKQGTANQVATAQKNAQQSQVQGQKIFENAQAQVQQDKANLDAQAQKEAVVKLAKNASNENVSNANASNENGKDPSKNLSPQGLAQALINSGEGWAKSGNSESAKKIQLADASASMAGGAAGGQGKVMSDAAPTGLGGGEKAAQDKAAEQAQPRPEAQNKLAQNSETGKQDAQKNEAQKNEASKPDTHNSEAQKTETPKADTKTAEAATSTAENAQAEKTKMLEALKLDAKKALPDLQKAEEAAKAAKDTEKQAELLQTRIDALKAGGNGGALLTGLDGEQMKTVATELAKDNLERKGGVESANKGVYKNLAETATGQQLADLSNANPELVGANYYATNTNPFSNAIRDHAPTQTKIDYVKSMAKAGGIQQPEPMNIEPKVMNPFEKNLIHNPQADAVGQVLTSLKGNDFDTAYKSLNADQKDAVFNNSMSDTGFTKGILNAAATSKDLAVRTEAFQKGSGLLDKVGSSEQKKILTGLTNILKSDTLGITGKFFESESYSPDKPYESLVRFMRGKAEHQEHKDMAEVLVKARFGNDPTKTDRQFLQETQKSPEGKESFVNQRNLGILYGSTVAGIEQAAKSQKDRANIASNILKSAVSLGGELNPVKITPQGIVTNFVADKLSDKAVQGYVDAINQDASKWSESLKRFATVQKAEGGRETVAGDNEFDQAADGIFLKYRTSQ